MIEKILIVILMIPIYGLLIWSYLYPEDSMLFGKKWMYEQYPEFSKEAIRYTKFESITSMVGVTIFLVSIIFEIYFLLYILILLFPVIIVLRLMKI